MGYMRHHAIIVTNFTEKGIEKAHKKALQVFSMEDSMSKMAPRVSEVIASPINGYWSFLIAPDGSKEGWADSDKGDAQREKFIAWMREERLKDREYYAWLSVQYGDDEGETKIEDDSDTHKREPNVNDIDA